MLPRAWIGLKKQGGCTIIEREKIPMKKISFLVALIILFFAFSEALLSQKRSSKDLPPRHRIWLEEEVVYIITPKEKDVFLQLETDRERELFIEAFWKHRDPNPDTPENEFKDEHYRRIAYANTTLGRGTPTQGWRTEMGRIYIILGEPDAVERYENETEVYPTVVWFYQGMAPFGLPQSFYVVFLKRFGAGDYELYSPIRDGPQSLLVHYLGDPKDYLAAYSQLRQIQPDLARVSLSLLPEEPLSDRGPTVASEILISNIAVNPQKAVKDAYAEKLLKYKDIVEVEYSANYIDSESLTAVIRDASGITFVHYLIEPSRLSVNLLEGQYYTTFEVSGQVADTNGRTVYQFSRDIPIRFDEDQRRRLQSLPFRYQDAFPLVEGRYSLSILMKNRVSKEFTSFEKEITVPASQGTGEMTPLVLATRVKDADPSPQVRPFKVGSLQLYPVSRNEFAMRESLFIFFQAPGLSDELQAGGRVRFTITKQNREFQKKEKAISEYGPRGPFLEEFSLQDFPPAHYEITATLVARDGRPVHSAAAFFSVAPVESIPRPFIYAPPLPPPGDPAVDYTLGGQYYNIGRIDKAREHLEKAYRTNPSSLLFAEGFGRFLFQAGDYAGAKSILLPFAEAGESQEEPRFLKLLGDALQKLEEHEAAVEFYKRYLATVGTNVDVLNAIGDSYLALNNIEEALIAFEKSLEIDANQERIKTLVSRLKDRK